jgi:hypothetical protein
MSPVQVWPGAPSDSKLTQGDIAPASFFVTLNGKDRLRPVATLGKSSIGGCHDKSLTLKGAAISSTPATAGKTSNEFNAVWA